MKFRPLRAQIHLKQLFVEFCKHKKFNTTPITKIHDSGVEIDTDLAKMTELILMIAC